MPDGEADDEDSQDRVLWKNEQFTFNHSAPESPAQQQQQQIFLNSQYDKQAEDISITKKEAQNRKKSRNMFEEMTKDQDEYERVRKGQNEKLFVKRQQESIPIDEELFEEAKVEGVGDS